MRHRPTPPPVPASGRFRTAVATWLDPVASVPIIDSLVGTGVVDIKSLREYIACRRARRGYRRAEQAAKKPIPAMIAM